VFLRPVGKMSDRFLEQGVIIKFCVKLGKNASQGLWGRSDRHVSINHAYYVEILKRLREVVRRKRPELRPDNWIFHRGNAPAHKELSSSFWPKN
jgi:hypothetical protein